MTKILKNLISSQASSLAVTPTTDSILNVSRIIDFIQGENFPCVGAKAALVQNNVEFRTYENFCDDENTTSLHLDIQEYLTRLRVDDPRVQSFVAVFTNTPELSEDEFEGELWKRLKSLHNMSERFKIPWNDDVSDDPENPHFSMSIAGHPFFIVGMHPGASRVARRSPHVLMVFNSNIQFDRLKKDGRYGKLQAIIRERDAALQGSINPNLADFGENSEARQYSGRAVDESWKCPVDFEGKTHESD